jgi:hypothetical protein
MSGPRALLRPDRVRTVERPFGWVPCRMLTNGTIAIMSPDERQLYLVLALAADRHGVSFYGDKFITRILDCTHQELELARYSLLARELLAYDGATYQLLSLPSDATSAPSASPASLPAAQTPANNAPRTTPLSRPRTTAIGPQRQHAMPESVQHILRDIFDRKRL